MDSLTVYLNDIPVGRLTDDGKAISFAYDRAYAADARNEPLSHAIPLSDEPFGPEVMEPFLSGLLPEDIIRTRLGRILQIPRDNTFAFLRAIGGDCAGAIAFYPEGEHPLSGAPRFRRLSDAEAGAILDALPKKPLSIGEDGFRISGAGAQDKLIACWKSGAVELPLDGTPSTHIIKTAIPDYPDSVENECYSMWLAKACGLNCAKCSIAVIGGRRRYVCERFDRIEEDGRVRRLHQEDFCQLLRVDPKRKYESLGGPGIAASLALMRELSLSAADTLEFLRRIVFAFLLGNGDAHGKNYSVLYRGRTVALSPMYDIMSTAVYPEVSARMAMKIDGEYAFKWITRAKFLRMAEKLGISPRTMDKEISRLQKRIGKYAPAVAERLSARFPSPCYGHIVDGILSRCGQLAKRMTVSIAVAALTAWTAVAATPEEVFRNPPREAHVGVWWHWMGAQVTEEGIRKDLDWFQRMGIFSATVFGMADSCTPWARRIGNVPTGGLRPFDERWWKLFAFACREGQKRGIDIGLHNCPGYTSTGGPWIPSRLAMRELVFNVTNATAQIPTKPNARFPVYNEDAKCYELPPCAARQTDVVEIGVARGGIRVAHIPMGAFVQPADWDTFGLECDKMNPEAVDLHLDHVIGELKRHLGNDLPAAGLRHILLDSYEAGTPTWTPHMREEFQKRRGYDCLEFLPILGNHTNLYTAAEVAKFRADFERTVKDLYRDVLFKRMYARLHAEGIAFSNEPYQGPFEPSEVSPYIDRIITEFWYSPKGSALFAESHRRFNRLKGPGGKRHNIVEAEAFTGSPENCEWTEMPANLKSAADDAFVSGVNRLIFHTATLQPWGDDVKPGVTMGRWGTHFGRNQTWAECGRPFFDYLARCQALLQWGEPCDAKLELPCACDQIARTDGKRTLVFVKMKRGIPISSRPVPCLKWYDPVSGRISASYEFLLAEGSAGFYEIETSTVGSFWLCGPTMRVEDFTPSLGDRSQSANPAARYFSGTLTYRTRFDLPGAVAKAELHFSAMADQIVVVRLNGRPAGTAWCEPYVVDLPLAALKEKGNELEIDVTNSWRNRLIGDEQEPADCEFENAPYGSGRFLVRYPDWFKDGIGARPSKGRKCFTTWNYFTKDSKLTPSGLIVPPVLMWKEK